MTATASDALLEEIARAILAHAAQQAGGELARRIADLVVDQLGPQLLAGAIDRARAAEIVDAAADERERAAFDREPTDGR